MPPFVVPCRVVIWCQVSVCRAVNAPWRRRSWYNHNLPWAPTMEALYMTRSFLFLLLCLITIVRCFPDLNNGGCPTFWFFKRFLDIHGLGVLWWRIACGLWIEVSWLGAGYVVFVTERYEWNRKYTRLPLIGGCVARSERPSAEHVGRCNQLQ